MSCKPRNPLIGQATVPPSRRESKGLRPLWFGLLTLAAMAITATSIQAAAPRVPKIYYVRVKGSDLNDGLRPRKAYKTLKQAFSVVRAGDIVHVGGGTYYENVQVNHDATASARISILADPTGVQTGDAGPVILAGDVTIDRANYVTLRGFQIRGDDPRPFTWIGGIGGELNDCEITAHERGIRIKNGAKLTINRCNFHDLLGDGLNITDGSFVTLRDSEIRNCALDGFRVDKGASVQLVNCSIHQNGKNGFYLLTSSGSNITRVLLDRCQVFNNVEHGLYIDSARVAIRNSLVVKNTKSGLYLDRAVCIADIFHCTIADQQEHGVQMVHGLSRVMNSIVANNAKSGIFHDLGPIYCDYNLLDSNVKGNYDGVLVHPTDLETNPKFAGAPTPYMLLNGSPAVDRGYAKWQADFDLTGFDLSNGNMDLLGTLRPQGLQPDAGCYEGSVGLPTDYYVSTSGNDSNDGRTRGTSFKTIGRAAQLVFPGNTVRIAAGTYSEIPILTRPATSTSPIKFVADIAGTVKVSSPQPNKWAMEVRGAHYTEFHGIRFTSESVALGAGSIAYSPYITDTQFVRFENCEFDHSNFGVYAEASCVHLKDCSIHDTYEYASQGNNGGMYLENCQFANNGNGPFSFRNSYFLAKNCQMDSNRGYCFAMAPVVTVVPTVLGTNTPTLSGGSYTSENGLCLVNADNKTRITFDNTTIRPKYFELALYDSNLIVTPSWRQLWKTQKGMHNLTTYYGDIKIDGMIFDGYREGWGVLCNYGKIKATNSKARNCLNGAGFNRNDQVELSDCDFVNNKGMNNDGWGLHLWAKTAASISNCRIQGNSNGLRCYTVDDMNLTVANTTISDNALYGLCTHDSDVKFTAATMATRWKLSNNGYAIVTFYGKALFDTITLADNTYWGAVTNYGDVTVRSCQFLRNGQGGLWSYNNKTGTISDSKFEANGVYGLAVATSAPAEFAGGPVAVTNCTIQNNNSSGLYLEFVKDNQLTVTDSPISGHPSSGILAKECELAFTPITMGTKWKLSNNGYSISTVFGKYKFEDITLSGGQLWGVVTQYSDVTVRNCNVTNNTSGFWSYKNFSFTAEDSKFNGNQGWGLAVSTREMPVSRNVKGQTTTVNAGGVATITRCEVSNNVNGLQAHQCNDTQLLLTNTVIRGNSDRGLECADSELNFTPDTVGSKWQLADNHNGIVTVLGKYKFENITIGANRGWGALTYYSDVTLKNSTFSNNGVGGFWSYRNLSCNVNNSKFSDNGTYGAAVRSDGKTLTKDSADNWVEIPIRSATTFMDSFIENNPNHGLYLEYTNDAGYSAVNTTIRNNTNYAVYAYACNLTFSPINMGKWKLQNNGYNIFTMHGRVKFDGVEFSDAKEWSVVTNYGDVTVNNSTFSRSPAGGFSSYANTSFKANGSNFTNNGTWGLAITTNVEHQDYNVDTSIWSTVPNGQAEVKNCTITDNSSGLYAYRTGDKQLTVQNTSIQRNTKDGLYAWESSFAFTGSNVGSQWKIKDNGYNISTYYGTTSFDGAEIADAKFWGARAYWGNVTVKNCTFTRNPSGGLYAYANRSFKAENSKFNGNGTCGLSVQTDGTHQQTVNGVNQTVPISGTVTLQNCEISGNQQNGLQLTECKEANLVFSNTVIENNRGHGVYSEKSSLRFAADTIGKWKLNGNGDGITTVYGDTVFDNVTLNTNSQTWGLMTYYGNVTADKLTIDGDGGGLYSYLNDSLTVTNSNLKNTRGWGLQVHPKKTGTCTVKLDNVVVDKNANGVYIVAASQGEFELKNTAVTNNTGNGLAFDSCSLVISDQQSNNWSSVGNLYGISFNNCPSIVARGVTASNCTDYGLVASGSNVSLENCIFSGHAGLYSYRNSGLTVEKCRFDGTADGSLSWGLMNYGTPATVSNSIFANFYNGVYVHAYDDTLSAATDLLNCTFASTNSYGVYLHRATGQLVNSIVTSRSGIAGMALVEGAQLTHSHNLLFGFSQPFSGTARAEGEKLKNPRFQDLASNNFELAKGSPAINSGKNLPGIVNVDYLGQSRGSFRVWDVGAYEFMNPSGSLRVIEWKEKR